MSREIGDIVKIHGKPYEVIETSPRYIVQRIETPDVVTDLSFTGNTLKYINEEGKVVEYDLSMYLDDTNLSRLVSGEYDEDHAVVTFTRDDGSTFNVDVATFIAGVITTVIDNLKSNDSEAALSANQGRVLNESLDSLFNLINKKQDKLVSGENIITLNGNTLLNNVNITLADKLMIDELPEIDYVNFKTFFMSNSVDDNRIYTLTLDTTVESDNINDKLKYITTWKDLVEIVNKLPKADDVGAKYKCVYNNKPYIVKDINGDLSWVIEE